MQIRKLTFEEYYDAFKSFYDLDYIYKEIDLWIKIKSLHGNYYKLIPSINEKHIGPPIQRDPLKDYLLNQILTIDNYKEEFQEINFAIYRLDEQDKHMFSLIFLKERFVHVFAESDLIITIAKNNPNYIFCNSIEKSYFIFKKTFIDNLKKLICERKKNLKKYLQQYPQYIPLEWNDPWIHGNGEHSRKRYMFICATLFKEGYISLKHFKELITPYHGGKKYYRFIMEQE